MVGLVKYKVEREFDRKKGSLATKEDVAVSKAGTIKWMFVSWTGLVAATLARVKFIGWPEITSGKYTP